MITDIALIILLALFLNYVFGKIWLPGILGMIATGIILGPGFLNLIDREILILLKEFKTAALIVILIRAGLGINKKTLNKIGGPAMRMSFIPGIIEGVAVMLSAHFLLGFTIIEGGMLGFIIAAVSPAVVVPQMLELKEANFGQKKEVPTLILAGASLDDVFAITIFGVFTGLASGETVNYLNLFIKVPAGIVLGAAIGLAIGFSLIWYYNHFHLRDTKKVLLFMIIAVLFYEFTEISVIKNNIQIAGLLGIMAIGFIILEKHSELASRLASKFGKIWVLAEIFLFVYIGTEVQISTLSIPIISVGLLILLFGLIARSFGVWLSLLHSELSNKEKLFCIIAYWPKATVQAAIGAVPLSMILKGNITGSTIETGNLILSIAVLSIVITAPIGAIGIKLSGPRLLEKN
jgi:solute carrier family 9B (sodium/hydrogen exchanger), member 1/2